MKYGMELIEELNREIERTRKTMQDRWERINDGRTDIDDCFMSMRCEERGIRLCEEKIDLIQKGGTAWFKEYATLDGHVVNSRWCETRFGLSLRAEMPDGKVVWTTAVTKKGLAKKGLKMVECRRPAWFTFKSSNKGMLGVYTGSYVIFPSTVNYATGKQADNNPIEVRDAE